MYYVYVLQSSHDGHLYIGYSTNIQKRLLQHNSGKVISTRKRRPFRLVYYEAYANKKDATQREYHIKTGQQREFLKLRIKYSLNTERCAELVRQQFVPLRGISRRETKLKNMYYVYILKSKVNGYLYIGSCGDLKIRLKRHDSGYVKSTKAYRPWQLVNMEKFFTRSDACKRERFLKTGQQKEILKRKFYNK